MSERKAEPVVVETPSERSPSGSARQGRERER